MKIAFTTDAFYPRTHGIAVAIDSSIRYLANQGHEVMVFTPSYPNTVEREYPKGVSIQRFDSYNLWFTSNKEERFIYKYEFQRMRDLLTSFAPDVVYNHLEFTVGFIARAWAKATNTPSVMMVHTYYPPYFKIYAPFLPLWFWRWFIKHASKKFYAAFDVLLTPSKEMREVIHEVYKIDKLVEVLPTGIIGENFKGVDREHERQHSSLYDKYPRIQQRKRLLFVGRVGKEKNVAFLLKMMSELLKKRDDVELLIAGSGSYMHQYVQMAKRLKIDSHVTFLGPFPNTQMKYIYAMADVFVFASLTETQGVVTTEALCNGLPVVAIAALGSISVLDNERGGFLVPKGDVDGFISKIELLLDNPHVYEQKRQESIARGKELTFDVLTGEQMVKVLTKAAALKESCIMDNQAQKIILPN